MAKIRGSKEGFPNDPSSSMPTENKSNESNKQKIAKIFDMFPITTKENIAKILQYYDDDENQAINALTSDGGKEALSNWTESGNLKKNSKKNKKKRKGKKDSGVATSNTASFDADDSSSIHSGCNVDIESDKNGPAPENGIPLEKADNSGDIDNSISNHERLNDNQAPLATEEPPMQIPPHKLATVPVQEPGTPAFQETTHRASTSSDCTKNDIEIESRVSPLSNCSEQPDEKVSKKEKYRSINENHRHSPRQRTSSFRRNKNSSVSEDSSSQNNPQSAAVPTKRGYEKCRKDLHRQTASLQRINNQLEQGFDDSEKRLRNAFTEILKLVEHRQSEIELQLASRRAEAFNLLKSRQDLCTELKRRVDRTASLTESEWSELRSDIKLFVTERKYDDDLGKTIWFQWPDISETIKTFGEVHPVKNVYSQRSPTGQENAATADNPDPSPSSSLANDAESSADKNDVGVIADAVEDAVVKEDIPPFNRSNQHQQHNENRGTRIYQNKNYSRVHPARYPNNNNNNNRGYFRGPRGGGGNFQRPFPANFPFNNRQHMYDPYFAAGDRNLNQRDFKGNRGRGRGGPFQSNYRYDNKFNRGGHAGGQRHNAEHFESQPPPNINAGGPSNEKQSAVNGVNDNNTN